MLNLPCIISANFVSKVTEVNGLHLKKHQDHILPFENKYVL